MDEATFQSLLAKYPMRAGSFASELDAAAAAAAKVTNRSSAAAGGKAHNSSGAASPAVDVEKIDPAKIPRLPKPASGKIRVKIRSVPPAPPATFELTMMAELSISDVRRMYELTMGVPAYACGVLKDGVVLPDHQLLADWGVNELELTVFVLHEVITHELFADMLQTYCREIYGCLGDAVAERVKAELDDGYYND